MSGFRAAVSTDLSTGQNMYFMNDFSEKLLNWYDQNRRVLPWREDPTPYHVWISEIMLQQTRAAAVKGYYARFIEALPDVKALADAEEDTYLKLWEGLGYYSRVRNLHKAALRVMEDYGGRIPSAAEDLIRLPGIGRYTAAAISSIAFGNPEPAVDGNLLRIFARLQMYEDNIRTPAALKSAAAFFSERMPEPAGQDSVNLCGNFNQALMDLGTAVCVPATAPDCDGCPVREHCRAHMETPGRESALPVTPARKEKKTEYITVFLIRSGDRTAVRRRPMRGLLAGLYEFPNAAGALKQDEARDWLRAHCVEAVRIKRICDAEHIFTHKKWIMRGYEIRTDSFAEDKIPFIMADREEIQRKYCIPSAFGAYADYLQIGKVKSVLSV